MTNLRRVLSGLLIVTLCLATTPRANAYAILTHQLIIDLTWDSAIVPLLLAKYPRTEAQALINARAYAYGGSLIQDAGYYATESHNMANMTHYVRSGDFVVKLFENVNDVNELAFAIGALSHYLGDIYGHRDATNQAVYLTYQSETPPRTAKNLVSSVPLTSVTYEQDTKSHTRVEFGFDVNALAHHRFVPEEFHQAVGLDVELKQFSMAYYQTYGYPYDFVTSRKNFRLSPYHYTAFHALPYVANSLVSQAQFNSSDEGSGKAQSALAAIVGCVNRHEFRSELTTKHNAHKGPIGAVLAEIPTLKLVPVDPTTQELYARSVLHTISSFAQVLKPGLTEGQHVLFIPHYTGGEPVSAAHPLANYNLDTGFVERPATYDMTDKAYISLLHTLAGDNKVPIPAEMRDDILNYFDDPKAQAKFSTDPVQYQQIEDDMNKLRKRAGSTLPTPNAKFGKGKPKFHDPKVIIKPIPADFGGCDPTNFAPLKEVLVGQAVP